MKAVIIEDEKDLAELLAFNLGKDGWQTVIALDGKSGIELVTAELPDIVILDLMLPEMSGIDVCKTLRKKESTASIPIIMVTAKGEEIDRVVGFEVGADDYLVKPFSSRELMLRIKAIIRRSVPELKGEKSLHLGSLTIDPSRHTVKVDNEEITLTSTEYKLLTTLAERSGRVQSRERLLQDVWGYCSDADTRTVDTHITRLRSKLGSAGEMIMTVRGFGYKLEQR
ncbi:MAG: response regulator transcription factor [Geobacteraceae bacterium]|nr:response regulator transcription factor [Geobacteraceae bacterium]